LYIISPSFLADTVYHEANLQSETLSVGEQASVVVVNCDDLDEIYVQRADQVGGWCLY